MWSIDQSFYETRLEIYTIYIYAPPCGRMDPTHFHVYFKVPRHNVSGTHWVLFTLKSTHLRQIASVRQHCTLAGSGTVRSSECTLLLVLWVSWPRSWSLSWSGGEGVGRGQRINPKLKAHTPLAMSSGFVLKLTSLGSELLCCFRSLADAFVPERGKGEFDR